MSDTPESPIPSQDPPAPEALVATPPPPPPMRDDAGTPVGRVVLKPRKSRPFFGRHPWVLDRAVASVDDGVEDGDVVELVSEKNKTIATGIYNGHSALRVRLYAWGPSRPLDVDFWRERLTAAVRFRRQLGYLEPDTACRLVFSEADGLSGLVVDRYGAYLALQPTSLGMARRVEMLNELLVELVEPEGIVLRTERGVSRDEGARLTDGRCWGEVPDGPVFITEHGLRYGVDLLAGQKTGCFLDQRENRIRTAGYAAGKSVLDLFCYSGGFSLAAARHGPAREVLAIDGSEKATALAAANASLNEISNVHFITEDCFDAAARLLDEGRKFGVVNLDPPKFARRRSSVPDALRAYHRINRLAVELLEPDGILVTSSCTGHVSREDFQMMLGGVAQKTGREIQILEQRGASPDHPISATCLESEYLKCFICRVV